MKPSARDVLVVIDMQNGFIDPINAAPVVPKVVDLVKTWSEAGGALLFTRYLNYAGSPYTRIIGWHKMQDSPEIDIVLELQPFVDSGEVLDKRIYTAFTDEGAALIKDRGWENLYICGVDTESCVAQTAVGAFERDLTPWVLTDACASHAGDEVHRAGLLVMSRNIGKGQLVTTADLQLG